MRLESMFTELERKEKETLRDFVFRVWESAFGGPDQVRVTVMTGYKSPYRFGEKLREVVNDFKAQVFQITHHDDDGLSHTIYFCFNGGDLWQPQKAVFYDPSFR